MQQRKRSIGVSDRELLELAGKALGIEVKFLSAWGGGVACYGNGHYWNPLTNSADALELAAKLNLSVITNWGFDGKPSGSVGTMLGSHEDLRLTRTDSSNDVCAGWRRAIVLGAVEIGKSL
jgi:hypothetical protein